MGDVLMPRLADSAEEGRILRWLRGDGDTVTRGEELVEIETDKAAITLESGEAGRLTIVAAEGSSAAPGAVIARVGEEAAAAPEPVAPQAEPVGAAPRTTTARGELTVVELTRAQQGLVRRIAEAKATVPDMALSASADMESALREREALRAAALGDEATPTLEDMLIKACALALREFPHANGAYRDGAFELHARVNVGFVVATAEALVVPTIFDADRKALSEIAQERLTLARRASDGSITPPELGGATFTVYTLAEPGVRSFQAVINGGQAGILAAGAVEPRPAVARDGGIEARHGMTLTLTCDHRILYGEQAAGFLAHIRDLLENPFELGL
jgi:pyruvate dehydrogenase E2 component (dihydrolipoamide acetyltransferase)